MIARDALAVAAVIAASSRLAVAQPAPAPKPLPAPTPAPAPAAPVAAARKPIPPSLYGDAADAFIRALDYERAGQLDDAIRSFGISIAAVPVAEAYFDRAEDERSYDELANALDDYRKYLELAPQAADRAAVEKTIRDLETAPSQIVVQDRDRRTALVYLDGKYVGLSPQIVSVPFDQWHRVLRISRDTILELAIAPKPQRFASEPGADITPRERKGPVNVVINGAMVGADADAWRTHLAGDHGRSLPAALALAPGHYEEKFATEFVRGGRAKWTCAPVGFDVAAGNVLTFVYVERAPDDVPSASCTSARVTVDHRPVPWAIPAVAPAASTLTGPALSIASADVAPGEVIAVSFASPLPSDRFTIAEAVAGVTWPGGEDATDDRGNRITDGHGLNVGKTSDTLRAPSVPGDYELRLVELGERPVLRARVKFRVVGPR